ncbi:MAG: ComEC/Rec2 family competence protein, partial [Candidatus Binatia bacterium]
DYALDELRLDAMISSHCDADHYGGLWDLLNPGARDELDCTSVRLEAFFHAGVSWWKDADTGPQKRWLGPVEGGRLKRLLEGKQSLRDALAPGPGPRLQGEWGEFLRCVLDSGCRVRRLHSRDAHVPGFGPDDGEGILRVLGPVEAAEGELHDLGGDSQNTNGNSVVLRLDYGRTRILLTGDLNAASHRRLLEAYSGRRLEFACDVAKACHHGSADVSYEFLSTMAPAATVISSGDSESHAHPRPSIVAASALTGHVRVERDELVTPLVYSTEISRSVRMGRVTRVFVPGADGAAVEQPEAQAEYSETRAGDLKPKRGTRRLDRSYIVTGIVYGLVNVRTDGERILCATLNEKNATWDVQSLTSRF